MELKLLSQLPDGTIKCLLIELYGIEISPKMGSKMRITVLLIELYGIEIRFIQAHVDNKGGF